MSWEVDPQALVDGANARLAGAHSTLADAFLAQLNPDGSKPIQLRHGKVVSFNTSTWTAVVTISGSTTQVPGVPNMQNYQLAANDPVWLVVYGPGYAVVGSPTAAKRHDDARIAEANTRAANDAKRVVPIQRTYGFMYTQTQLQNDAIPRQTHYLVAIGAIPAGSVTAHVSFHLAAHCVANAATHWSFTFHAGFWVEFYNGYSHNQGNPAVDIGAAAQGILDVRNWVTGNLTFQVVGTNDAGSGGWTHVGPLHWTATFMGLV